jgi:putative spermidine/putrescine transport system permease protein
MRPRRGRLPLMAPGIILIGVMMLVPLAMAIYQSLHYNGHWSVESYAQLFAIPFSSSIPNTLLISVETTVIAIVVSIPACDFVSRHGGRFGMVFFGVMALAFTLSTLTRTMAWQIILASDGPINTTLMALHLIERPITLLYTRGAVLVAMVQVFIPYAAMVMYAGMRGIDRGLIMASRTLGANGLQTFRHAYWPQFKGSLVLAVLIVFSGSVGTFVVPSVLGGPGQTMWGQLMNSVLTSDNVNGASRSSAAGVMMMVFLVIVLVFGLMIMGRSGAALAPSLMSATTGSGRR